MLWYAIISIVHISPMSLSYVLRTSITTASPSLNFWWYSSGSRWTPRDDDDSYDDHDSDDINCSNSNKATYSADDKDDFDYNESGYDEDASSDGDIDAILVLLMSLWWSWWIS